MHVSEKHSNRYGERRKGIGAAVVEALLKAGLQHRCHIPVRSISLWRHPSNLVLVAGDIGNKDTAAKGRRQLAMENFGSIDLLVTNAGIFSTKPFTEFTTDDFNALVFDQSPGLSLHRAACGGADAKTGKPALVVSITAALADQPIAGVECGGPDDHQGRTERK